MTVATEKVKLTSERYSLVRIAGARYLATRGSLDGSLLNFTWDEDDPLYDIRVNGVSYDRVESSPADGEWSYDEDTGAVSVNLPSIVAIQSVVGYFYKFFTSGQDRRYYETPTDDTTTVRVWKGRLESEVSIRQSVSNQESGFLTTNTSSIKVIDLDRDIQHVEGIWYQYSGVADYVSYYKKDVDIWLVINGEIVKTVKAICSRVSSDGRVIQFDISDKSLALDVPAYMNDTLSESTHFQSTLPIPYVFGNAAFNHVEESTSIGPSAGLAAEAIVLDQTKCQLGRTTAFGGRTYALCRTDSDGLKTLDPGSFTVAETLDSATQYWTYHGTNRAALRFTIPVSGYSANWQIGDSFAFTDPVFAGTQYAVVMYIDLTAGDSLRRIWCMVMTDDTVGANNITGTISITTNAAPGVLLFDASTNTPYLLSHGLDFTMSNTTTAFGNIIQRAALVASFETATAAGLGGAGTIHPGLVAVDPFQDAFVFKAFTDTKALASAIGDLIESAGLTLGSGFGASFGSAAFTVPYFSESDFNNVRNYVQDALKVTGSAVILADENDDVNLIDLGSAVGSPIVIDDTELIDSLAYDKEYRDMVTSISYVNEHNPSGTGTSGPFRNSYLHDTRTPAITPSERNLLQSVPTLPAVNRNNPKLTIRGQLAAKLLGSTVGDSVSIRSDQFFDQSDSDVQNLPLKIVGIAIGPDGIAFDLCPQPQNAGGQIS